MKWKRSHTADAKAVNDKFTSFLNKLPVGVYRVTLSGAILQANRQFAKTLGYDDPKELASVNMSEIYANKPDRQAYLEKLRKGPVFGEFEICEKTEAPYGSANTHEPL